MTHLCISVSNPDFFKNLFFMNIEPEQFLRPFAVPRRLHRNGHGWNIFLTVTQHVEACATQVRANVTYKSHNEMLELPHVLLRSLPWSQLRRSSRTEPGSGADDSMSRDVCSCGPALTGDRCVCVCVVLKGVSAVTSAAQLMYGRSQLK